MKNQVLRGCVENASNKGHKDEGAVWAVGVVVVGGNVVVKVFTEENCGTASKSEVVGEGGGVGVR